MMFGFACKETSTLMPLPIYLAHRLVENHAKLRQTGQLKWLRPDAKSQVTVEYNADGTPNRIHTVVISTQHDESVMVKSGKTELFSDNARQLLIDKLILPTLKVEWPDLLKGDMQLVLPGTSPDQINEDAIRCHINPTGNFLCGGPHGDCGLTGRKIIVDTYGGRGRHGGGAFSGKDPTKVDRSAAYACRYLAKNVVAAGLADKCTLQISYAIGIARPLSVYVDLQGTGKDVDETRLEKTLRELMNLSPRGIREHLHLNRPIYAVTSAYGHFGRTPDEDKGTFTWEKTDLVPALQSAFGR